MAIYGDSATIKRMLAATGTVYDANTLARLDDLNAVISLLFEQEVGRSFGDLDPDATLLVWARGGNMLLLPMPAWSITSVFAAGDVTGDTMTGGSEIVAGDYVTGIRDADGQIYALMAVWGEWRRGMPVTVTGQWANADRDADVPVDVVMAVNKLIVETFKTENLPATTEDGVVVLRSNPWTDPLVERVIKKYTISTRVLVL